MIYKINSCDDVESRMYVSPDFLSYNNIHDKKTHSLSFGQKTKIVRVIADSKCKEDELRLSRRVMEALYIPDGVCYQINCTDDNIRLGPIIGLLMGLSKRSITAGKLKQLLSYTNVYPQIGGLLFAFSVEGIDYENLLVEGYYYNPERRTKNKPWQKATLPFPDSIFQRANLSDSVMEELKKLTNNRIFNSCYFNKWEFWEMTLKYDEIREHIPFTRMILNFNDIDNMLERYKTIYLKPVNGTLARGLIKVSKEDGVYLIKQKSDDDAITAHSMYEVERYLKDAVGSRSYIAQQALRPIMINNRPIDFRVIMQKDDSLGWKCTGIVAFIGRHGGICSNWGYQTTFEDALADALNFRQEEVYKKGQEIITACRNVCKMLDNTGENFGDLGFDVLIDKSLKVWILEVNKRHYHSVPLWIKDEQTFYAVKANPIKYAAALSGFYTI